MTPRTRMASKGSSNSPIQITHGDLRDLADEGLLKVGAFYIIEDFQTIYARPDYDGSGTIKSTLTIVTADVEPLIVQAIAPGKLSSTVKSTYFPLDQIQYDINVITTFDYNGATNSAPCKGRITERITPDGLRTDYDHRVVEFIRYERLPGTGEFYYINDNGGDTQLFNTFDPGSDNSNLSLPNIFVNRDDLGFEFPNTIFLKSANSSTFYGYYTSNNTFFGKVFNNLIGACTNNITGITNCTITDFQENVGLTFSGVSTSGTCNANAGIYDSNGINNTVSPYINGNILGTPEASIESGVSAFIENNAIDDGSIINFSFTRFSNNTIAGTLQNLSGSLDGKTLNVSLYPDLFSPVTSYVFFADPNGDQYYRYFDGSTDVTMLIV